MCFTLYYYAPHWCAVVTFCHSGRLYYNRHSKTHYASKNMVCRNTLLDWTCTEAAIISVYNTLLYNMLTLLYHTSTSNWYTCWKNSMVIAKNMQTVMSQEVFSKPPISKPPICTLSQFSKPLSPLVAAAPEHSSLLPQRTASFTWALMFCLVALGSHNAVLFWGRHYPSDG